MIGFGLLQVRQHKIVASLLLRGFDDGCSPSHQNAPPGAPVPPILPPQNGFLFLDNKAFPAAFAGDVDIEKAEFKADSQVPRGVEALRGVISEPAWRTKPSWYLVVPEDKMIPPDAQRAMSKRAGSKVIEIKGSHAIYLSNPEAVTALIEEAVTA